MAAITDLWSTELPDQPCCLEFSQREPDWMVIGTYRLQEPKPAEPEQSTEIDQSTTDEGQTTAADQKRTGSLMLAKIEDGKWQHVETLHTDFAILDLKFHPQSARIVGAATSDGSIAFFVIRTQPILPGSPRIVRQLVIRIAHPSVLVTSLAWSHLYDDNLAVSLSTGGIWLLGFTQQVWLAMFESGASNETRFTKTEIQADKFSELRLQEMYVHSMDDRAWTVVFANNGCNILSGGEDAILRGRWRTASNGPLTVGLRDEPTDEISWNAKDLHTAGIVAILPLTHSLYLTGSYDDKIRLVQISAPHDVGGKRVVLADLDLGGGVWRLKLLDLPVPRWEEQYDILASCMYAGVRIVRLTKEKGRHGAWNFEVLAEFQGPHESINYATDFQPIVDPLQKERLVVSTSFYDRRLCTWTLNL